ncbi:MAG: DUF1559 domain-containing protein [Isosphaeraceae bacterium]
MAPARDLPGVASALLATPARQGAALASGTLPRGGFIPSSIMTLVQGVTTTMFARQLAARAAASMILGTLMMFEQTNGFLPPAAIRDLDSGEPLLSWRVAVLPWLGPEAEKLYQEFDLNEPWDGPHNKTLPRKMPEVFAPVGVKTAEPFTTFYQVFVGPGTAFEPLAGEPRKSRPWRTTAAE